MLFFLVLIISVFTFSVDGVNWWTGSRISKNKFSIDMHVYCKNDILKTFERDCDTCYFEEKIFDLGKDDTLVLEYVSIEHKINIFLNDEFMISSPNQFKCFYCIQKKFK